MEHEPSYLGMRSIYGGEQPFGLSAADRRQHVYVIGKTGTGKSTLLRNLIAQDIHHGHGVGLIDPHGELAEELLDCVPPSRINDVVYFNPADVEHPIGFNLLHGVNERERHLVTSGIVGSLKGIYRDSWGPRLEYVLYAAIAALQECQNVSLLCLPRMLVDDRYRDWVVRQVKDPMVRAYWLGEFASYDKRLRAEIIAPIQNKVGQLFMAPVMRNILGQVQRKIDMRFMMDRKRIFIANLGKGRIGEDKANLLGSLLVTEFQLGAMRRADVPEHARPDFLLYVDEFQNFATDSFASMLSEARKYRLALLLSHQYGGQVAQIVRDAIFGNVGTIITLRTGERDAELLERELGRTVFSNQIVALPNHEAFVRPLTKGEPADAFHTKLLPRLAFQHGGRRQVIEGCRRRYAVARDTLEQRIHRWSGKPPSRGRISRPRPR